MRCKIVGLRADADAEHHRAELATPRNPLPLHATGLI
jgi:hypothetical protein